MCLITTNSIKTAENDITVYKTVFSNNDKMSWVGLYQYNDKEFPFDVLIENKEKKDITNKGHGKIVCVGAGFFHSTSSYSRAYNLCLLNQNRFLAKFYPIRVCECVIPKGTEYYADENDYASKNIIVKSKQV